MNDISMLVDSSGFMPHGNCYLWQPLILWLHVASDAIIGISYFSIPVAIVFFLKKRADLEFRGVFYLFAAFIIACGTNHFIDIYTTWNPSYMFEGVMKAFTALLSIGTAVLVWPLIPLALKLPSPAELKAVNQNLEDKNNELTHFAYRTSHDLKAPMITARALAKYIQKDIDAGDYEEAKTNSKTIIDKIGNLENLINEILEMSKADLQEHDSDRIDMHALLEVVEDDLSDLSKHYGVRINSDIHLSSGFVSQQTRVKQIIENLVSNSVKYADQNQQDRFVNVVATEDEQNVYISVEDNGVGLEEDHKNEIFTMFKRFRPDLSFGSGLGMAIVKKHVERLGGEINILSPEKGTSIQLVFNKLQTVKA